MHPSRFLCSLYKRPKGWSFGTNKNCTAYHTSPRSLKELQREKTWEKLHASPRGLNFTIIEKLHAYHTSRKSSGSNPCKPAEEGGVAERKKKWERWWWKSIHLSMWLPPCPPPFRRWCQNHRRIGSRSPTPGRRCQAHKKDGSLSPSPERAAPLPLHFICYPQG